MENHLLSMFQVARYLSGDGSEQERTRGLDIAKLLSRAWRETSPANFHSHLSADQLDEIAPILCQSGAGALAWCKIRNSPLANTPAGCQLHEVYRRQRLSALIHEREIAYVFSLLNDAGIEAVLVKGWAIARRYPDAALRPYGDIDLCVRRDQIESAKSTLRCLESIEGHHVDLHAAFEEIGRRDRRADGSSRQEQSAGVLRNLRNLRINRYAAISRTTMWDEILERSLIVKIQSPTTKAQSCPVRILCDEDHLRILSQHLLRSGAWRPPWLCDVALLLEAPHDSFNWDICLGRNSVDAGWVASVVALAHQLLGADIADTPFARNAGRLPRWLVPAVLRQWGRLRYHLTLDSPRRARFSINSLNDLYSRWDNPIRSTAAIGGQFNSWPRLPYRVAESVMRLPEVPRHFRLLREERRELRRRDNPQIAPITQISQSSGFESL